MGALPLNLGIRLRAHYFKTSVSCKLSISRLLAQNPPCLAKLPYSHSLTLIYVNPKHSHRTAQCPAPCSSASWSCENWETDEDTKDLPRSWIGFLLELDGTFEILALVLGVAVSAALAASRNGVSGLPVATLSLAFVMAATGAFHHQIGHMWAALMAQFHSLQVIMAEKFSNFQDSARNQSNVTSKKTDFPHVLSMRGLEQSVGNGASVHTSVPTKSAEIFPPTAAKTSGKNQASEDVKIPMHPVAAGAYIEGAVTDIAKCVAQLALVVAHLEEKIVNMEKGTAPKIPVASICESPALETLRYQPVISPEIEESILAISALAAGSASENVSPGKSSYTVSIPEIEVGHTLRRATMLLEPSTEQGLEKSMTNHAESLTTEGIIYNEAQALQNGGSVWQESVAIGNAMQITEPSTKWEEAVLPAMDTLEMFKSNEITNTHICRGQFENSDSVIDPNENDSLLNPVSRINTLAEGEQALQMESVPVIVTATGYSNKTSSNQSLSSEYSQAQIGDISINPVSQDALNRSGRSKRYFTEDQVMASTPGRDASGETKRTLGQSSSLYSRFSSPVLGKSEDGVDVVDRIAQEMRTSNRTEDNHMVQGEEASGSYECEVGDSLFSDDTGKQSEYESFSRTIGPKYSGEGDHGTISGHMEGSQHMAFSRNRSMGGKILTDSQGIGSRSQSDTGAQIDLTSLEMTSSRPILKEKPVNRRGSEVRATQSGAGWDEFPLSRAMGNGRRDDYREMDYPIGVGRGTQRSRGVNDESSYEGDEQRPGRRPGPPESQEGPSLSRDTRQQWRRGGPPNAADVDFGGNGSSGEENEGDYNSGSGNREGSDSGRRQWRQDSSQGSDVEYETEEEGGIDSRGPQEKGSPAANPSYPPERSESYRNLPVLKSKRPEDERFQQILDEVEALLNEGKEGLEGRIEVGVAERMLYEAADLCAKAVALRPSSLVAVGLWGNTLLLHGELKLRLSQNLRRMLPEPSSVKLNRRDSWEAEQERLGLEATLQEVSEECEQLLVEAGRKYRSALSMDRTDMRALYNWGLALCYRGQLIAEEGGESAAQDADKVYLAAIDKFEAMMGLSEKYASGALLNWGLAMRDRSRLRPMGNKERMKILLQAREIFQEALRLDPNYGQARGAVAACTIELKELQEFREPRESREQGDPRGFRDWWG